MSAIPFDNPIQVNLDELRRQLSLGINLLLIAVSATAMWLELFRDSLPGVHMLVWLGLLVITVGTQRLSGSRPWLARHSLIWGAALTLIAAMYLFEAVWLPFLGLPLVFVAMLLTARETPVLVVLLTGVSAWYTSTGAREYPILALILAFGVCAILAWLVRRNLYTALEWAWTSQCRATELLELSRDRQGELNRALKSLEMAYSLQARTQRELYLARKQAEEARQMKERFAANISHELRTPLNLILGFSELMYISPQVYGEINWPPALRRDIHHIYRSSRHLLEMIDDILDLSRLDLTEFTLNREPTELPPLLTSVIEITEDLFRLKSVDLQLEIEDALPVLDIDRTRIRQVLLNLLNNAQRFTSQGVVRITAQQARGEVMISVQDTGAGIPADKLPYIFDEFYQVDFSLRRSHEGAGLGLAICKQFVEAHHGRIWVESQEGIGTKFSFALPLPEQIFTPTPDPLEAALEQVVNPRPPILLVEADPRVAAMLRRHLASQELIQVNDPARLPAEIEYHHPHAVICNTPPGTSPGYLEALNYPVAFITCSLPSHQWIADHLQVAACLTKPVTAQDVLDEIARLDGARSVLLIDDDRGFCHLVERILQTHSEPVALRMVYNGKAGMKAMRDNPPDLLLLDLAMPVMDGFEVLDQMRADPRLAGIPVILLTATSYIEDAMHDTDLLLSVRQPNNLRPAAILSCLQSVLASVEPRYEVGEYP